MTLEMEQIKMGKEHLVESGWKAENVYDPEADVELMEDDKVEAEKRERRKRNEGFFSCELQQLQYLPWRYTCAICHAFAVPPAQMREWVCSVGT